jgi:uncharacterized protein YcbX
LNSGCGRFYDHSHVCDNGRFATEFESIRVVHHHQKPIDGSVTGLFIYPVKSLRAVWLPLVEMDDKRFVGARRYMVVYPVPAYDDAPTTTTHRFLTRRQCPVLATVIKTQDIDSLVLQISNSGTTIRIPIQQQGALDNPSSVR